MVIRNKIAKLGAVLSGTRRASTPRQTAKASLFQSTPRGPVADTSSLYSVAAQLSPDRHQAYRRFGAALLLGAALTLSLGIIMAQLIAAEFTPSDAVKGLDYAVNAQAEDLPEPPVRERPKPLEAVDVPPPMPRIATQSPTAVTVPIVPITGARMDWKPARIDPTNFIIQASDRDEQPIFRNAPAMPMRADRSGHCIMAFDVTAEGAPFNVKAVSCSQSLFARASEKAVSQWRYNPKIVDGQPTARRGLRNQITFNLVDERGNLIPE